MKKNIFKSIVPVLLCVSLLLSIVGKISAYADFEQSDVNGGDPLYFSKSECIEKLGASENYIFANLDHMQYSSSWGCDRHNAITFYYKLSDDVSYTEENGYYVVNITGSSMCYKSGEWHYDSDRDRTISDQWGAGSNNLWTSSSYSIKIKTDLSEIVWGNTTYSSSEFVSFDYKIGELEDKYSSVRVVFTPSLVGDVDRRLNNGGLNSMLGNIKVDIYNDGDTAIQYRLAIYEKNSSSSVRNGSTNSDVYYGDDPIFVLYKNEWVYSEVIPDWKWGSNDPLFGSQEIDMGTPMKYQKPSEWHYIPARSGSGYTIKFSQIHFKQGVEYTVKVDCVTCPYENVSSIGIDSDRNYGKIDFSTLETVYESDFRILQYEDSEYKPDDDSLGILPYDGYAGNGQANEYSGSYLAYDGGDGNIHYESVKGNSGSNFGSSFFPSQSGTEYNTVISHSTSALGFMSTVLSWFPFDIFTCINIALWFSVILFIIKKV